jgi:hypothetical protein
VQRGYIFVTKAPDDYEDRVRAEVPDENLVFVSLTTGGYDAFVVLDAKDRDQIDDLVERTLGSNPAGGHGVETSYATTMRGLKNI